MSGLVICAAIIAIVPFVVFLEWWLRPMSRDNFNAHDSVHRFARLP
jgi:hypothetical protein